MREEKDKSKLEKTNKDTPSKQLDDQRKRIFPSKKIKPMEWSLKGHLLNVH